MEESGKKKKMQPQSCNSMLIIKIKEKKKKENKYLKDEMRIEPDFMDRRNERIEEGGSEIDESVGSEKSGGDRRFPWQPVILVESVKSQQRQHSPRHSPSSSSSLHLFTNSILFLNGKKSKSVEN